MAAVEADAVDIVKLLLKSGVKVYVEGYDVPLHVAIEKGIDIIRMLKG